jgi:hypothetical protein
MNFSQEESQKKMILQQSKILKEKEKDKTSSLGPRRLQSSLPGRS